MRILFSVVSLLVVLAIVGMLASKKLRAVGHGVPPELTQHGLPLAAPGASETQREQVQNLESKVANDVAKSLNDGAAARQNEADKP